MKKSVTGDPIMIPECVISFPHLFEPDSYLGNERYRATFLIDQGAEVLDQLRDSYKNVRIAMWGDEQPDNVGVCFGNDDDRYPGQVFLKASAKPDKRPTVVNRDKTPIVKDDNIIYGGAIVNAFVTLWAHDHPANKRVNCNLLAVQFVRDGERLGGGDGGIAGGDLADRFPELAAAVGNGAISPGQAAKAAAKAEKAPASAGDDLPFDDDIPF